MGLFSIRGRSDSANQAPYERPRKRKKAERKKAEGPGAVSVEISHQGEKKFKNDLFLKNKLENEVTQILLIEQEMKNLGIPFENFPLFNKYPCENLREIKDFLFQEYINFYGRPNILGDHIIFILDSFDYDIIDQAREYFKTQTKFLSQEHLKLI